MAGESNGPDETRGAAADLPGAVDRESLLSAIVEGSADAIVSIDEEATVVFANAGVRRVFGYDPAEVVGTPLTRLLSEDQPEEVQAAIGESSFDPAGEGPWTDVRLSGVHRDGHEMALSITVHEHRHGDRLFYSGTLRDVTDRVEHQRELEHKNEQLEHKNEQLERFASILSHDLRDPLNSARAQLALAREYDDERHLDELEAIHDRLAEIVEDVLTLTKEGGTVEGTDLVDLRSVAEDAWATAGVDADEASLEVADEARVRANPERLRTLLENLLGNAVRHGGADVTVTVSTLPDGEGFAVSDDGTGLPSEHRGEVLEYGFTTSEEGTGLGLSIVRDIAQAHGWTVTPTESDEGGARFEFRDVEFESDPGG